MATVKIRAKSQLKLQTPNLNMDFTYPKGCAIGAPVKDVVRMIACSDKQAALDLLKGLVDEVQEMPDNENS